MLFFLILFGTISNLSEAEEENKLDLASAEMKSIKDGWPASKLIDGNKGSPAHTLEQPEDHGLWIRVNLAKCSSVTKVIVYNRDSSQQRIIGASLFIKTGDEYVADCGKFDSAKDSYTFDCRGDGNRIEISQDGRVEHPWHLAEIEVYGTSGNSPPVSPPVCKGKVGVTDPKNIARRGTAEQIDGTSPEVEASNAIDGSRDSRAGTITKGKDAWWLLTLPSEIIIREIKVYNREGSDSNRIDGVTVWVGIGLTGGDYERAVKVRTIEFEEGQNLYIFSYLYQKGSSVQIQGGKEIVSLIEVEVHQDLSEYNFRAF
ncbi:uncharacterized protein LOC134817153 [Bolinopsis microptera]|uniref:uncharacterized protein LOC134817153 n=1 Tax=Bolinopsis microptera TaxID=2820187 RepID=UPI003078FECD